MINGSPGTYVFELDGIWLCIKKSFVDKFGDPTKLGPFYDLMNTYHIRDYLHNADGPAIYRPNHMEVYFLNGKEIHDAKEAHNIRFSGKLDDLLK